MLGHDGGDLEGHRCLEEFGGGGDPREGVSREVREGWGVGGWRLGRAGLHGGEFMNGSAKAFLDVTDAVAVPGGKYH